MSLSLFIWVQMHMKCQGLTPIPHHHNMAKNQNIRFTDCVSALLLRQCLEFQRLKSILKYDGPIFFIWIGAEFLSSCFVWWHTQYRFYNSYVTVWWTNQTFNRRQMVWGGVNDFFLMCVNSNETWQMRQHTYPYIIYEFRKGYRTSIFIFNFT